MNSVAHIRLAGHGRQMVLGFKVQLERSMQWIRDVSIQTVQWI
jgi:hypothetical protein